MNNYLHKFSSKVPLIGALMLFMMIAPTSLLSQNKAEIDSMAKEKGNAIRAQKKALVAKRALKNKYEKIDSYALAIPAEYEQDVVHLAGYLTLAPPCISREEKLRSIYTWITENIEFNWLLWAYENDYSLKTLPEEHRSAIRWRVFKWGMFFNKKRYAKISSLNSTLKYKRATEKGISELFDKLCYEGGLKSVKINGYKKPDLHERGDKIFRTNHNWNAVFLGKKWFHIDIINRFWIDDQDSMRKTMIPAEPMWQMTKKPLSMEGFINGKEDLYSENYNYSDSIKMVATLPPQKAKMTRAFMAHRFNPDNFSVIAYAYYNASKDMYLIAKSPKTGMKRAKEGYTLASKNYKIASGYLKSIKKTELKPVMKLTVSRNKTANKEKIGEFKVLKKELQAREKEGPPASTLQDDLAEIEEEYTEKEAELQESLTEELEEAGDHEAMLKLVNKKYDRLIDSTDREKKTDIAAAEFKDKEREHLWKKGLKATKDSIMEAEDQEEERFNRINKITKKQFAKDAKKNTKDTYTAKNMSKKAKKEAKKLKSKIKGIDKKRKLEAKKADKKAKEEAKKQAAKEKKKAKK